MWRFRWLEELLRDVRYGLRGFLHNPVFTLTAVIALCLGIGATTAIFSVVDRILFRSLPYPNDDHLVSLGMAAPIEPQEFMLGSDYMEWREHQTPFEAFTSWSGLADCDITDQSPVRASCAQVESTFLPTLGIQPIVGRNFARDEDQPNASRVALLSYGLWQGRFGGDRDAVGKTISLDGQRVMVVGVLPADFELPTLDRADLLIPQAIDEATQRRPNMGRVLGTFARLKPGITLAQAEAALQPLFQESLKFVPPQFQKEVKLRIRSVRDRQVHDARLASWVLLGSVLAVLLIACANVANLLLARAASRQREMAVRAALGAGRVRLIRQALAESLLLGAAGGMAGCALAHLLLRLFVAIAPEGIPRLQQAGLNMRVLLFTLAGSLLCGILFGLAPALHTPRPEALSGRRAIGPSRNVFRHALIAAQIAVSLILLTGASLLLRTFWNLQSVPLGMRTQSVLTAGIALSHQFYSEPARQLAFFEELEARLERLPGVTALAISDTLPPGGPTRFTLYAAIEVQGRPQFAEGTGGTVVWRSVTPGYFSALDIPILQGRGFQEVDRKPNEYAIILSDSLARRMFPNEDPLGKQIRPGLEGSWFTIIGTVGNVKNNGLAGLYDPEFYYVRKYAPDLGLGNRMPPDARRRAYIILRTTMNPQAMAKWVRAEVSNLDPTLPVALETMNQLVSKLAQRPKFNAVLLGLFAVIGMLLAAIGLYGVISFLVAQRTQEIGVRMTLGATPAEIMKLVLSHAARWTLGGATLGLIGSLFTTRLLGTMLFAIPEKDPLTLGAALVFLLLVALLAAWIPARRASRVDPMVALRYE